MECSCHAKRSVVVKAKDKVTASIIICSLGRDKILRRCLGSIKEGSCQDYEIILCQEEGNLVELKQKGWQQAKGEILIWIDDDVVVSSRWLENIIKEFKNPLIVGLTGPTYVPPEYLKNRDIFRKGFIKWLYNKLFMDGKAYYPGIITKAGAPTYGANYINVYSTCAQEVDFLEPSNFAFRREAVEAIGGFDCGFKGVAEWCDVDMGFKIKLDTGKKLFYSPKVRVTHMPTKGDKVYNKRLETKSRYSNYLRFAKRWVKPCFKHWLYKRFLWTYFWLKGMRWI